MLTYQNLFAEKEANPQLRTLRFALDAVRRNINENLGRVKRVLGPDSRYYELVESIEKHLSEGMSVTLLIDGGISWNRWLEEIGNAHDQAEELLSYIKSETNVRVSDLADQKADFKDKLIRWLDSIGNELTKFIYEASSYVHQSLRIHYLIQASGDEGAGVYKELADRLERLSWARTNVDYQEIEAAIPGIRAIVVGLP